MGLLSETIMLPPPPPQTSSLPPFAECIVLVTIHGWCGAACSRTVKILKGGSSGAGMDANTSEAGSGGGDGDDFWTRQRWLSLAVENRLHSLDAHGHGHGNRQVSSSSVHDAVGSDSMLLFAHMLAHSAVIKLGQTAQQQRAAAAAAVAASSSSSSSRTVKQQEEASRAAAAEMVLLARQMPSFGCFKVHPFLPDLLGCAATYLCKVGGDGDGDGGAQQLLRVLADMQGMNSLARDYLRYCVKE